MLPIRDWEGKICVRAFVGVRDLLFFHQAKQGVNFWIHLSSLVKCGSGRRRLVDFGELFFKNSMGGLPPTATSRTAPPSGHPFPACSVVSFPTRCRVVNPNSSRPARFFEKATLSKFESWHEVHQHQRTGQDSAEIPHFVAFIL